ncbi:hypothetical protein XH84_10540 [Bradyrhizobium nanningense]|uniref:hypothetical protein n=1 Tax=Bradyrhizobium nanningense TaxID=1325118 RepID=UPI001008E7D2|nr:hypothetical protein [Bradyrhizobium nanningense]RXH33375.1 hypothetical protein XH84_10540 [Bradyrhizobium nanningense]
MQLALPTNRQFTTAAVNYPSSLSGRLPTGPPPNLIRAAIEEEIPPLAWVGKLLQGHFGRDLTDGEPSTAGKAVHAVAEELGHPQAIQGAFSIHGSQHGS